MVRKRTQANRAFEARSGINVSRILRSKMKPTPQILYLAIHSIRVYDLLWNGDAWGE